MVEGSYLFGNKHVLSAKEPSGTVLSTDEVVKEQIGTTKKWKTLIHTFRELFAYLLDSSHLKDLHYQPQGDLTTVHHTPSLSCGPPYILW